MKIIDHVAGVKGCPKNFSKFDVLRRTASWDRWFTRKLHIKFLKKRVFLAHPLTRKWSPNDPQIIPNDPKMIPRCLDVDLPRNILRQILHTSCGPLQHHAVLLLRDLVLRRTSLWWTHSDISLPLLENSIVLSENILGSQEHRNIGVPLLYGSLSLWDRPGTQIFILL